MTKPARKAAEAFGNAPSDAKPARWHRGSNAQVTISLALARLDQSDHIATRKHLTRSAMLTVLTGGASAREAHGKGGEHHERPL